ncbi:hypothetical protein Ddc_09644 [Ditylenchus destructor]|nr:hypothetical protein Ddc_09644 [Ditylenchus destructor]
MGGGWGRAQKTGIHWMAGWAATNNTIVNRSQRVTERSDPQTPPEPHSGHTYNNGIVHAGWVVRNSERRNRISMLGESPGCLQELQPITRSQSAHCSMNFGKYTSTAGNLSRVVIREPPKPLSRSERRAGTPHCQQSMTGAVMQGTDDNPRQRPAGWTPTQNPERNSSTKLESVDGGLVSSLRKKANNKSRVCTFTNSSFTYAGSSQRSINRLRHLLPIPVSTVSVAFAVSIDVMSLLRIYSNPHNVHEG